MTRNLREACCSRTGEHDTTTAQDRPKHQRCDAPTNLLDDRILGGTEGLPPPPPGERQGNGPTESSTPKRDADIENTRTIIE